MAAICGSPNFDRSGSIRELQECVQEFDEWLRQEATVEVWFPSIKRNAELRLTRIKFIKMCGNISKHNVLRAVRVARELKALLAQVGISVNDDEAMLALEEFYERFHGDILNYHSTTIVEFLNNMQWGIHEYLMPEFRHSYKKDPEDRYKYWYVIPGQITDGFAETCYWDVMNNVRRAPNMPRFQGTRWSKLRY